jgi:hypothetical protein
VSEVVEGSGCSTTIGLSPDSLQSRFKPPVLVSAPYPRLSFLLGFLRHQPPQLPVHETDGALSVVAVDKKQTCKYLILSSPVSV